MRKVILVSLALTFLSGCAHVVQITSRSTGATGTTSVPPGRSQGPISILLNGKTYSGTWVYVPEGGGVSLMSAVATTGYRTASLSGTAFMMPTGGNGKVMLHAADGSHIVCVFNYSSWSNTGMGECQDNAGEMYDVEIGR